MLISLGSFKSYCGEFFGTGKAIKLQLKGEKKRKNAEDVALKCLRWGICFGAVVRDQTVPESIYHWVNANYWSQTPGVCWKVWLSFLLPLLASSPGVTELNWNVGDSSWKNISKRIILSTCPSGMHLCPLFLETEFIFRLSSFRTCIVQGCRCQQDSLGKGLGRSRWGVQCTSAT